MSDPDEPRKKFPRMATISFLGLFVAIGVGMLGWATYSTMHSMAARHWPVAEGQLISSELKENFDSDGNTYRVVVQYSYRVKGVLYEGNRIAFGYAGSSGQRTHRQIYDKLRSAKAILVRYSPDDPKTSVLSFGFHRSVKFLFVFAVTWLLFSIGMALMFWLFSRPDNVLLNNLGVR